MVVKEKLPQGGGLGPVVGGEDHLPEEVTHVTLASFPVSHPTVCHLQYEKRLTHMFSFCTRSQDTRRIKYEWIIGLLDSNTIHSKSTTVCNITLLCPSLGKQSIASPAKTYCMAKADNAFL